MKLFEYKMIAKRERKTQKKKKYGKTFSFLFLYSSLLFLFSKDETIVLICTIIIRLYLMFISLTFRKHFTRPLSNIVKFFVTK